MEDETKRPENATKIQGQSRIRRVERHLIDRGDVELTLALSIVAAILIFLVR